MGKALTNLSAEIGFPQCNREQRWIIFPPPPVTAVAWRCFLFPILTRENLCCFNVTQLRIVVNGGWRTSLANFKQEELYFTRFYNYSLPLAAFKTCRRNERGIKQETLVGLSAIKDTRMDAALEAVSVWSGLHFHPKMTTKNST